MILKVKSKPKSNVCKTNLFETALAENEGITAVARIEFTSAEAGDGRDIVTL